MLDLVLRRTIVTTLSLVMAGAMLRSCPDAAAQNAGANVPRPYIGVVTGDNVYVRSGAAESYYPYAKMNKGDLVQVVGEKFNWARVVAVGPVFERKEFFGYVVYPSTQPGRFRLERDGRTGVVLGREDILAPNLNTEYNPSDSWKPIARLEPNTRVTVIETLTDNNRTIQKVKLPEAAEGWISRAYIREATEEEVLEWRRAIGELPEPGEEDQQLASGEDAVNAPADVLGREEQPRPAISEPERDSTEPMTTPERPAPTPTPVSTREPAPEPSLEPAPERVPEPTIEPARSRSTDRPVQEQQPTEPDSMQPSAAPSELPVDASMSEDEQSGADAESFARQLENVTLDDLEQAFERLREEPIETAEVEPLRRMYLELARRSDDNARERRFAEARADQLQIWAEIQSRRAELADLHQRAERTADRTQAARLAADAAADYVAVGMLAASTIYDGKRLPKMLRVQDPGTGRTVAYVEPSDRHDLVSMIGQLVGIVGEKAYDGGLRLNIVQPRRVDLLAPQR